MPSPFTVNPANLTRLLNGPDGPVWQGMYRLATQVQNKARALAPVDQGQLRASIAIEMRNQPGVGPTAIIGTNVKYALFVHEGTGIYSTKNPKPITPKSKKVLRWPVKNQSGRGRRRYRGGATAQYAYAKSVKGVKGRPFLRDALKSVFGTA